MTAATEIAEAMHSVWRKASMAPTTVLFVKDDWRVARRYKGRKFVYRVSVQRMLGMLVDVKVRRR